MFYSRSIWIASVASLCGMGFIGLGAGFCAATLHVPKILSVAPKNAKTVEIPARDNARLSAWWFRPSEPNTNCVIVLHGIQASRGSTVGFAPMFLDEGYAVLVPDSRAHGASGGKFVTYGL